MLRQELNAGVPAMTAKQHRPARTAPSEWQHIVTIATSRLHHETPAVVPVTRENIAPKMDVYTYGGRYVGRVKHVSDSELVSGGPWQADTRVPLEHVFT